MTSLPEALRGPVRLALAKAEESIPSPSALPAGAVYELKWDGYRVAVVRDEELVRLWSRQGKDLYVAGIFNNAGYQDTPMRGLAKYALVGGYPDLRTGWRAPGHRQSHHVGVDALGDVIHVNGGGDERQVRLAVREPGGIAYAGQVYLPLGGDSFYRLSYVSRTAG